MSENNSTKPVVLILGATGLTGRYLIDELDPVRGDVHVKVGPRRPYQVEKFRVEGRDAVLIDLDDPKTFSSALFGVDRLFLLIGYSVAMLAQSKTIEDAARKARVRRIVHLGTFGNWDVTDPHLAWHQLVECYIEASGIAWTHPHPNVFIELLPTFMPIRNSSFPVYLGEGRAGWIPSRDLAAAAAVVLRDGPEKHGGQVYWLSAEVASDPEIAIILTEVLGRPIRCELRHPDEFSTSVAANGDYSIEPWYAEGTAEFLQQMFDGRMGYIGTVRDRYRCSKHVARNIHLRSGACSSRASLEKICNEKTSHPRHRRDRRIRNPAIGAPQYSDQTRNSRTAGASRSAAHPGERLL